MASARGSPDGAGGAVVNEATRWITCTRCGTTYIASNEACTRCGTTPPEEARDLDALADSAATGMGEE